MNHFKKITEKREQLYKNYLPDHELRAARERTRYLSLHASMMTHSYPERLANAAKNEIRFLSLRAKVRLGIKIGGPDLMFYGRILRWEISKRRTA